MELTWWSVEVVRKAEVAIEGGKVRRDAEYPDVWYVESSGGDKEYRVQTDGKNWITCTCPSGTRQAGMAPHCFHTAAVLMQYLSDKGRFHVVES